MRVVHRPVDRIEQPAMTGALDRTGLRCFLREHTVFRKTLRDRRANHLLYFEIDLRDDVTLPFRIDAKACAETRELDFARCDHDVDCRCKKGVGWSVHRGASAVGTKRRRRSGRTNRQAIHRATASRRARSQEPRRMLPAVSIPRNAVARFAGMRPTLVSSTKETIGICVSPAAKLTGSHGMPGIQRPRTTAHRPRLAM